jgi:hypothetical protein
MAMKWPWPPLKFGDYVGLALVVAILVLIAVGVTIYPGKFGQTTNAGFGPEWECTSVPQGDPVCLKRTGPPK